MCLSFYIYIFPLVIVLRFSFHVFSLFTNRRCKDLGTVHHCQHKNTNTLLTLQTKYIFFVFLVQKHSHFGFANTVNFINQVKSYHFYNSENYGFKNLKIAPLIESLSGFENDPLGMINGLTFYKNKELFSKQISIILLRI